MIELFDIDQYSLAASRSLQGHKNTHQTAAQKVVNINPWNEHEQIYHRLPTLANRVFITEERSYRIEKMCSFLLPSDSWRSERYAQKQTWV